MSNSTITSSSVYSSSSDAAASSSFASAVSSSIASEVSSSITAADSTTTVEPSSANVVTSVISASSAAPTTNVITSVVTQSAVSNGVTDTNPITVVVTSVNSNPASTTIIPVAATSGTSSASATSSSAAALSNSGNLGGGGKSSGLSTGGKTAIAVVIPVAFVALLLGLGIWFWRKRKQRKDNQEQRRKEIDEYGYNPNNDPTLPGVASEAGGPQMTEDSSGGYRGWGATTGSNRKASTTLSGGHTQGQLSDSGNSYGRSPGSPGAAYSDGHSGDPLVNQRDTMGSDELGALGAAPAAASNQPIRRGPSNASSAYSAGARSEGSDEPVPQIPGGQPCDINPTTGYGYSQHGPYGDGSYGGGQDAAMPVVRDVSARRNTRIQQAGSYQQGNSGIAQNF